MKITPKERSEAMHAAGLWGNETAWQLLQRCLHDHSDRVALIDPPNRSTLDGGSARSLGFEQVKRSAEIIAAQMTAAGVEPGAHILVQLPNISDAVVTLLAAARLGIVVSPIPMQYAEHEIRLICRRLHPAAYVGLKTFKGEATPSEVWDELPIGTRKLRIDPLAKEPSLKLGDYPLADDLSVLPPPPNDADAIITVCWTAGSTGTPKGVPRSHNQWRSLSDCFSSLRPQDGDTMLCPLPMLNMFSIAGFMYPWLENGATLCLHHPMDVNVFFQQLQEHQADWVMLPPALLNLVSLHPVMLENKVIPRPRVAFTGGGVVAPAALELIEQKLGTSISNVFGSSEGLILTATAESVPDTAARATCFSTITGSLQTRLYDASDNCIVTQPQTSGEIQIAGPQVIDSYLTRERDEEETVTEDGYFRCGDIFELSEDQPPLYRFMGRHKNIISRGGMQISPDEVATLIRLHPAVREAVIIGVTDAVIGERVCVVLELTHGTMTLKDIHQFLDWQGLAKFKWPERLLLAKRLPRNRLGKIDIEVVRALIDKSKPTP